MPTETPLLINLSVLMDRPTGISTYAMNLMPQLQDLHPLLLRVPRSDALATFPQQPIPAGMTPEQGMKGHLRRLLWLQRAVPRIYRQRHGQLLFSPLPEAPLWSGCRTVVTVHDLIPLHYPAQFRSLSYFFRYYVPQVLRQAEHVLCDSQATAEDVIQFYGLPAKQLTVVPLACDRTTFRPLNLPLQPYFLYLGRHDAYKNLGRVISAFQSIANRSEASLWIAGPRHPRWTMTYEQQVEDLGIAERVRFLDYLPYPELPRMINQAIGMVFPSLWEGFGLPILEAMACGTPVITSNLGSMAEIAADAALLVDPTHTQAIAQAMLSLEQDSRLRQQLQRASLNRAACFSWEQTGQQTAAVLKAYL